MSIAGLLNQTCTIYGKSSYNAQGREIVGSGLSVRCRFQAKKKTLLSPRGTLEKGQINTTDGIVFVPAGTTVAVDDKVVFDGQNYRVHDCYKVPGGNGQTHHIELVVIKWQT